jgi:HEPN domain-containing protein
LDRLDFKEVNIKLSEKDQKVLNSFASECFVNTADYDYISARSFYRMGLIQHFQWSSLQAIEKYLKAILLFNGKHTKNLGHKIDRVRKRVSRIEAFNIPLSNDSLEFILELNKFGENRYLEREAHTRGNELKILDHTIWTIRKYCQPVDFEITLPSGDSKNILHENLKRIESRTYNEYPAKFQLIGGKLEWVLKQPTKDLLRQNLVWKNFYYGARTKRIVKNFPCNINSVFPPHIRDPKKIELLKKYVILPGEKDTTVQNCPSCGEEI